VKLDADCLRALKDGYWVPSSAKPLGGCPLVLPRDTEFVRDIPPLWGEDSRFPLENRTHFHNRVTKQKRVKMVKAGKLECVAQPPNLNPWTVISVVSPFLPSDNLRCRISQNKPQPVIDDPDHHDHPN